MIEFTDELPEGALSPAMVEAGASVLRACPEGRLLMEALHRAGCVVTAMCEQPPYAEQEGPWASWIGGKLSDDISQRALARGALVILDFIIDGGDIEKEAPGLAVTIFRAMAGYRFFLKRRPWT